MKNIIILLFVMSGLAGNGQNNNGDSLHKIRVIMIGAHPDDCEDEGGGTAVLFSQMGYAVKFVSVTNGDAGHPVLKGAKLAKRRLAEAQEAGRRLGVTYEVLNYHDGLLMPTLEARLEIIKKVREWNADIVIAPRPNDYHPDHRYTAILVQDAAYMVTVPNILPSVAALKNNPLFVYFHDFFQKPNPFHTDIAIDITGVFDVKISALEAHESQMYEWLPWISHRTDMPKDKAGRTKWLAGREAEEITPVTRAVLEKWYGKDKAAKAVYAEEFEICEYGAQPTDEEIRRLFPMLGR
jgi:LmbE family N-acetylglucosaminyl deacetylase